MIAGVDFWGCRVFRFVIQGSNTICGVFAESAIVCILDDWPSIMDFLARLTAKGDQPALERHAVDNRTRPLSSAKEPCVHPLSTSDE